MTCWKLPHQPGAPATGLSRTRRWRSGLVELSPHSPPGRSVMNNRRYIVLLPAFLAACCSLTTGKDPSPAADEYSVRYHGFTQTHLDGLCHLIYKGKVYNGFSQKELTDAGARKLGIENIKNGIFTRCVLMDMPSLFDVRFLESKRAIYPKD